VTRRLARARYVQGIGSDAESHMRHLGSLVLTIIMAPAIWVLTGIGVTRFAEAKAASDGFGIDLAVGLAAFLAAGTCYAVLVLPRLSPLGPVLGGLGFLGMVVWRVADVQSFDRVVPEDFLNISLALRNPAEGYAALLAVPLLILLFSGRRWRKHEYAPAATDYAEPTQYYEQQYAAVPGFDDPTWPNSTDTETTRRL
jgi:hypothetical protein